MRDRVSQVIVDLYQGVRLWTPEQFQENAFELVKSVISFDSGMWGTGANSPYVIHSVHLYRQPSAMMEHYTRDLQHEDFVRAAVCENPGVTVNLADLMSPDEFTQTRIYKEFCVKYGILSALSTTLVEPLSTLFCFISLWRKRLDRPFSEAERQIKQALMPHLLESHRLNRFFSMRNAAGRPTNGTTQRVCAISDRLGVLHDADTGFIALLRSEWPSWQSAHLPSALRAFVAGENGEQWNGKRVMFCRLPLNDLVVLEARKKTPADRLGQRERSVAELYAQGMTYAEVAQALGSSASTVRNQLVSVYRKLGVQDKAMLARALNRL